MPHGRRAMLELQAPGGGGARRQPLRNATQLVGCLGSFCRSWLIHYLGVRSGERRSLRLNVRRGAASAYARCRQRSRGRRVGRPQPQPTATAVCAQPAAAPVAARRSAAAIVVGGRGAVGGGSTAAVGGGGRSRGATGGIVVVGQRRERPPRRCPLAPRLCRRLQPLRLRLGRHRPVLSPLLAQRRRHQRFGLGRPPPLSRLHRHRRPLLDRCCRSLLRARRGLSCLRRLGREPRLEPRLARLRLRRGDALLERPQHLPQRCRRLRAGHRLRVYRRHPHDLRQTHLDKRQPACGIRGG